MAKRSEFTANAAYCREMSVTTVDSEARTAFEYAAIAWDLLAKAQGYAPAQSLARERCSAPREGAVA